MHRKLRLLLAALTVTIGFSSCVSMSPQARRERAYRHYVQKQIKKRQHEIARAQKAANRDLKRRMKNIQPSDPQITTSVQDVSGIQTDSDSEPERVVPPVTVSASDSITGQRADQPSPP